MFFRIQVSNPKIIKQNNVLAGDVGHAIFLIIPSNTEDAFMNWQGIRIPISYKYDMCNITLDILYMLDEILSSDDGFYEHGFSSNTFSAYWDIKWDTRINKVWIKAKWDSISADFGGILDYKNSLEIEINQFLSEW